MKGRTFPKFFDAIVRRLRRPEYKSRASNLAYSLLMAAIPLMLVFIQLASLFLANPELALYDLTENLPDGTDELLNSAIDLLSTNTSSMTIGVGVLSALWLGSTGFNSLIISANESYGFQTHKNGIIHRLIAAVYTAVFMLMLIVVLLFYVFYDSIHSMIGNILFLEKLFGHAWTRAGHLIFRILPLILMILVLVTFYKTSTISSKEGISWREAAVGGVFSTVGMILITLIYTWFTNNISNLSLYYGSLAAVLALLVWLQYICLILVAGAEIIAAYREITRYPDEGDKA